MLNEFVIKINNDGNGNDLSLTNIPIEAIDALNIFLVSLKDFASQYKKENVRFAIKDGCIETVMSYPETETDIDKEIEELLDGTSVNNSSIKIFKSIQDKVKQNGLEYSIIHRVNGVEKNITSIFKDKNFSYKRGPKKEFKEEILFIEGTLYDAGGKVTSNIHVESNNEEFTINCTKEQAAKVRVYNKVYVAVLKTSKEGRKPHYKCIDSYLKPEQFEYYEKFYKKIGSDKSLAKYDIIHDAILNILNENEPKIGKALKIMRLYNFNFSDRGVIRTILISLKPFKSDRKISEMYQSLANTLRAGSKNNVI
ncbi:MAG TPA: hypothetical protein VN704_00035 [Verrucomicrobiae bacterium]|nr:hypothetical protein [Verrucomicrobiae bacterium]